MCGRFTYLFTWSQLHALLRLSSWPGEELTPRYNVAPTQLIPAVRTDDSGEQRHAVMLRWGLVPFWADDLAIGSRMINARSETAATSPAFRAALAKRRCIVPMSGFFEWQAREGAKVKQPYLITRADHQPLLVAGLWERWIKGPEPVETVTLLTTDANALMRPIHNRMPVILDPTDVDVWLGKEAAKTGGLLHPCPPEWLRTTPISTRVNRPQNDDPSVLESVQAS